MNTKQKPKLFSASVMHSDQLARGPEKERGGRKSRPMEILQRVFAEMAWFG